jgi:tetratricopeptide (TPR) repeat protein
MAYDWNGNVSEAIGACQTAIELDPTYAEGYAYLAEAYVDAVRWAEANESILTALELDDRSVDVHRNHGYVLEVQGNWYGAMEAYERALAIHPNMPHILIAVGRIQRVLGDFDAALLSFQRAADVAPDSPVANDQLGWTYFNLGEHEQAETYLKRAADLSPESGQVFGHLAINYWARRNYEEVIPNLEQAIRLDLTSARRQTQRFYITTEARDDADVQPSADVVLSGNFVRTSEDNKDMLQATLTPNNDGEGSTGAHGTVMLDARTGEYTVELKEMPILNYDQVYVGWFDGLRTVPGDPLGTGPLWVRADGSVIAELETGSVEAVPIDYYYTLGLAYYYLDECDKAYPLFDAALEIDPEEPNSLEGIRLCQISEE